MTIKQWQERDARVNWHPYTQQQIAEPPLVIDRGLGTQLWDVEGNSYIDAISSWWCNIHGHCHPYMAKKISEQLTCLEHVLFGGVTHPWAIELSEKLLHILPNNQSRIFYSDNGSTSVEVALKMVLQFFYNKKEKRKGVIAFHNAFHGDTFGAMASSGIGLFTQAFADYLLPVYRLDLPTDENIVEVCLQLEQYIKENKPAAFIFEPLIQGAAGMKVYKAAHLDRLMAICKENHVFCIADEVLTGFGRTGTLFACDQLTNQPDIMCLSKALTGGMLPMAATSCTKEIYEAFLSDSTSTALLHGHTYTAYPTGCVAALASLDLTLSTDTQAQIKKIEKNHQGFIDRISKYKAVYNAKQLGVILRFDLSTNLDKGKDTTGIYNNVRDTLYTFFIGKRIILRPLGNTLYILPPYCITEDELQYIYDSLIQAIEIYGDHK